MSEMYQQGDVLLIPIQDPRKGELPEGAKAPEIVRTERVTLALGEVTGHSHVIDDVDLIEDFFGSPVVIIGEGGNTLKHIDEDDVLTEEHEPLEIEPGAYMVREQREYTGPESIRQRAVVD
jgi:hypothetical protein